MSPEAFGKMLMQMVEASGTTLLLFALTLVFALPLGLLVLSDACPATGLFSGLSGFTCW